MSKAPSCGWRASELASALRAQSGGLEEPAERMRALAAKRGKHGLRNLPTSRGGRDGMGVRQREYGKGLIDSIASSTPSRKSRPLSHFHSGESNARESLEAASSLFRSPPSIRFVHLHAGGMKQKYLPPREPS